MSPDQFFSHPTAAAIYGMPVPLDLERSRLIHVSSRPPADRSRVRGVLGHRVLAGSRTWRGFPVADPIATWMQLAPMLATDDLVVAGDFLVRRKRPLATLAQLHAAAAGGGGRGIRRLRAAVMRVRAGTDSPMETRLRLALIDGGLPEPVVGHAVRDAHGGFVATPDLAYVAERIAIEYEGEPHWNDRRSSSKTSSGVSGWRTRDGR